MRPLLSPGHVHDPSLASRFIPFGMGRHTCLGRGYALMEVKTIVSAVLKASVVSTVDDHGLLSLPVTQRIKPCGSAYFFPSRSVLVTLRSHTAVRVRALLVRFRFKARLIGACGGPPACRPPPASLLTPPPHHQCRCRAWWPQRRRALRPSLRH